jgi:hypothetical protein
MQIQKHVMKDIRNSRHKQKGGGKINSEIPLEGPFPLTHDPVSISLAIQISSPRCSSATDGQKQDDFDLKTRILSCSANSTPFLHDAVIIRCRGIRPAAAAAG